MSAINFEPCDSVVKFIFAWIENPGVLNVGSSRCEFLNILFEWAGNGEL